MNIPHQLESITVYKDLENYYTIRYKIINNFTPLLVHVDTDRNTFWVDNFPTFIMKLDTFYDLMKILTYVYSDLEILDKNINYIKELYNVYGNTKNLTEHN